MRIVSEVYLMDQVRNQNRLIKDFHVPADITSSLTTGNPVAFENCKFQDAHFNLAVSQFSLINCEFQSLTLFPQNYLNSITISNCVIKELKIRGGSTISVGKIKIEGMVTRMDKLIFESVFCGKCSITNTGGIKDITMNVDCQKLEFDKVSDIDFTFLNGKVADQVTIKDCTSINGLHSNKLKGNRFECSESDKINLAFESTDFKYMNFQRNEEISLSFNDVTADSIGLWEGNYKKVSFIYDCNFNLAARLTIINPFIKILEFTRTHIRKDRTFSMEDIIIGNLTLDAVFNEGSISFINCNINEEFSIIKSSLSKSQFTNITLGTNCRVRLLASNIYDTLFNSFKWTNKYKLFELYDPWTEVRYSKPDFYLGLRESYRQLKANYLKNGNKIEALEFQKNEMTIHYQILSEGKWNSFRTLGNYLIVGTNKWFSDFGQNIWKPLLCLFIAHLLIFNMLLIYFNFGITVATSLSSFDLESTSRAVSLYFYTLLPTHPFVLKNSSNADIIISGFWDFTCRVFSGYFIYYFISASRKYHQ